MFSRILTIYSLPHFHVDFKVLAISPISTRIFHYQEILSLMASAVRVQLPARLIQDRARAFYLTIYSLLLTFPDNSQEKIPVKNITTSIFRFGSNSPKGRNAAHRTVLPAQAIIKLFHRLI